MAVYPYPSPSWGGWPAEGRSGGGLPPRARFSCSSTADRCARRHPKSELCSSRPHPRRRDRTAALSFPWILLQRSQNAFHHAVETGINVRIPESENPEPLRLQKGIASPIRTNAVRHSVLTTVGLNDELGSERNEVDDVTADRCLPPEMKPERFQFAQLYPQFDFLRRETLAKRAGGFVCQGGLYTRCGGLTVSCTTVSATRGLPLWRALHLVSGANG
jgi:hypothetical protein